MFREAAKRERRGDNLTGKQNLSTTVGTSHFMLVMAIFTPFAGAECRSSVQSSTAGQSRSLVSKNAAVPCLHVPIVVDEFCLLVKVSPCITLTRFTSNFHSNMLQYSVSGLVMLDAFT